MKYYILTAGGEHNICLLNDLTYEERQELYQDIEINDFRPIGFKLNYESGRKPLTDYNGLGAKTLSKRAFDILYPMIKDDIYKPIECFWSDGSEKHSVYMIRIKDRIDCIDLEKSIYDKLNSGMYIMLNYVIDASKVVGRNIFLADKDVQIIVSQEFVDVVEANNLTGFNFKKILTSEEYDKLKPEDRPQRKIANKETSCDCGFPKSNKPMVQDLRLLKRLMNTIKKKTKSEAFVFEYRFEHKCSIFDSKVGGVPYWNVNESEYPVDMNGDKMILIAQINLEDITDKSAMPSSGMLQFYITKEYTNYGLSLDKVCKVVYHATIDDSISEEDVLAIGMETTLEPLDFPIFGEAAISFGKHEESMEPSDYRYEEYEIKDKDGKRLYTDEANIFKLMSEEEFDELIDTTRQNKILGYPYFEQMDPRYDYREYNTLLIQLDSYYDENNHGFIINWGSMGIANFFIRSTDLRKRNFDDVLFNWDCE